MRPPHSPVEKSAALGCSLGRDSFGRAAAAVRHKIPVLNSSLLVWQFIATSTEECKTFCVTSCLSFNVNF